MSKLTEFTKKLDYRVYKLNQLDVIPSDEILQRAEALCEQAEKVRAEVYDFFDIEEGA